jgi:hypothetical protein
MSATVTFQGIRMTAMNVRSMRIGTSVDLSFCNEQDSRHAFRLLKERGVHCYHAGSNSPTGPMIMCYPSQNGIQFNFD